MKNSIFNKYYKWFIAGLWAILTLTVYSQFKRHNNVD